MNIKEQVMAARLVAMERWPYFAPQLLSMVLVEQPGIGTCATDTRGRFYFDPEFVKAVDVYELATVWLHESLHIWLDHAERRQGRNPRVWNMSVDREINDDLYLEGMPFPKQFPPLLPIDIGQRDGQLAEFYFEHESQPDGSDGDSSDQSGDGDESDDTDEKSGDSQSGLEGGSSMDGIPRDWEAGPEDSSGVDEIPQAMQECIRQQVSENVVEHCKSGGHVPAGIALAAQRNMEPPKVPWQKEMASAIRACAADVAGAVDFTYRKPSRRQSLYGDVIMPAVRRPVPETVIVLDTSGSMYGKDLESALTETQGVLKALGGTGIRVLATDSQVHSRQRVTHTSKIEVLGGGGTDMRIGLREAAKLKPSPDICIVLTDGYTPWPRKAPKGMRVIVGITSGREAGPSWARTINING